MKIPPEVLIHQLVSLRAQVDAMLTLLTDEQDNTCSHPPDKRLSLTTLGGPEHWICKACDFQYREDDR